MAKPNARRPGNGSLAPFRLDGDWHARAACRGMTVDLFFRPADAETRAERGAREAAARAVCENCPVRAECLAHAVTTGERYGIWGGLTAIERRHLLRRSHRAAG